MIESTALATAEFRRDAESRMRSAFRAWGYREIDAPVLMDYEVLRRAGSSAEDVAYKLVDEGGRIMVLRPDMTAPIAEMASRNWSDVPRPLRVCYFSRLFRRNAGDREFFQAGAELLGGGDVAADAEVIGLCCDLLDAAGVGRYQINLGDTGVLEEIATSLGFESTRRDSLRDSLARRDMVAVEALLEGLPPRDLARAETLLPYRGALQGQDLGEMATAGVGDALLRRIEDLMGWLRDIAPAGDIGFDPSLVRKLDYYTGPVFEVYCPQTGEMLGGGGRYDGLMGRFGMDEPATGFAVDLGSIESAAEMNGVYPDPGEMCLVIAGGDSPTHALELARELRDAGKRVILERMPQGGEDALPGRARTVGARRIYLVREDIHEIPVSPGEGDDPR